MEKTIVCPVCGKSNSKDTNYCSNCGEHLSIARESEVKKYRSPILIYLMVTAVVLIALGAASAFFTEKKPEEIPPGYLKISAKVYRTQLVITNGNDFALNEVEVILNPDANLKGFSLATNSIGSGDSMVAEVTEFAKKNGSRFNPLGTKLTKVAVKCVTPLGEAIWESNSDLQIIE